MRMVPDTITFSRQAPMSPAPPPNSDKLHARGLTNRAFPVASATGVASVIPQAGGEQYREPKAKNALLRQGAGLADQVNASTTRAPNGQRSRGSRRKIM